jgi:hypothetical protein
LESATFLLPNLRGEANADGLLGVQATGISAPLEPQGIP